MRERTGAIGAEPERQRHRSKSRVVRARVRSPYRLQVLSRDGLHESDDLREMWDLPDVVGVERR
jgi:hypothetical protein